MATITLRPVADISIRHKKYENGESSSASAYTLIDDVVSDEAATTIGQAHHSTSLTSLTSSFKLGGASYNHKIFINSITIYYDYWCNNPAKNGKMTSIGITKAITVNGVKSSGLRASISDVNTESDSGSWKMLNTVFTSNNFPELSKVFDSIDAMNLQIEIATEWKCGASTVTQDQHLYISQVYVVVDYTDAYEFTAIGNETTDVVFMGMVRDGSTVYFEAMPKINHRFLGWFSDSACTQQVSTDLSYAVVVNGADKTLYANSKRIEAINVYYKKNGTWDLVQNLYIKENGQYISISSQEFGNQLYFSERSYLMPQ